MDNDLKIWLYSWEFTGNYRRLDGNTATFSRMVLAKTRKEANKIVAKTCMEYEWNEKKKLKVKEYEMKDGLAFGVQNFDFARIDEEKD